ncbi:MAG: indolepyruvate oxidoreductase subunit beta [Acidobacteria bacterium]|nr:indolepyruvate oxidoreductase subunit beta [Acidobacteriota bacterium]
MKKDLILAGVGGQGILSIAFVIDNAVLDKGWKFRQAEVHGMAQRGGAVQSHLRYSDKNIWSDLVPVGSADVVLAVEPLESLRYIDCLSEDGMMIVSSTPYINIPDYPEMDEIISNIKKIPKHVLIDSEELAKEAGSSRAQNIVMLGASSKWLGIEEELLKKYITMAFERKGEAIVQMNHKAFDLGRDAAEKYKV